MPRPIEDPSIFEAGHAGLALTRDEFSALLADLRKNHSDYTLGAQDRGFISSALPHLEVRVGFCGELWETSVDTEVTHEQEVYCAVDGEGTPGFT